MSRLAVVAYPHLSEDDRRWIEGIRARHDPLASRIAAHITLVFPTELDEAPVVSRVRRTVRFRESVAAVLRRASASPDTAGGGYVVSLVAHEGRSELRALHEALYDSIPGVHGHRALPFIPHITVGRHEQRAECERIAGRLDEERRCVRARVESVVLVDVGGPVVRPVAVIRLRSSGNQPPNAGTREPGGSRGAPADG